MLLVPFFKTFLLMITKIHEQIIRTDKAFTQLFNQKALFFQ